MARRRKNSFSSLGLALVLGVLGMVPALADDAATATRIAAAFIVPRVSALATAGDAQAAAWRAVCAAPDAAGIEKLKSAFAGMADAWAGIELVHYGPASEALRLERMAYWPDKKNAVSRGLAPLLAGSDPQDLKPERLRTASVAAQGLSALERVLFEGTIDATPAGQRRCAVGAAIANAVAVTAGEIRDGWKAEGGLANRLGDPATAREALTRLATDLVTLQEVVAARKLRDPMGPSLEEAKPKKAEMVLSGRTMQTIVANLAATQALTRLMVAEDSDAGANALATAETAHDIAARLTDGFENLATTDRTRRQLLLLINAVEGARETATTAVQSSLGIAIGFNGLDGD